MDLTSLISDKKNLLLIAGAVIAAVMIFKKKEAM